VLVIVCMAWAMTEATTNIRGFSLSSTQLEIRAFYPWLTIRLRGGKGERLKPAKPKKKKSNIQTWAHFTGGENFGQDFNLLDKSQSNMKTKVKKENSDMVAQKCVDTFADFKERARNAALMEERKPFWERDAFDEDIAFNDRKELLKLITFSYNAVCEQLNDLDAHSVLDVGCGSGRFIMRANSKSPQINRFMCVDRRKDALDAVYDCFHRAVPFKAVISPRIDPMKVLLCLGDVRQAEHVLRGYQVATILNVLEETSPESIPQLSRSVFGEIKPPHVICMICVSPELPNSEELSINHVEWTDKVLETWINEVMDLYPYKLIKRIDNGKSCNSSNFISKTKIESYDYNANRANAIQANSTTTSVLVFRRTIEEAEVFPPIEPKIETPILKDLNSLTSDHPSQCRVIGEFWIDKVVIVGKAGKASAGWTD